MFGIITGFVLLFYLGFTPFLAIGAIFFLGLRGGGGGGMIFFIKLKIGYKSTFSRSRARLVTLSEVLGSFYITGNRSLNFLKTQLPNCR